MSVDVQPVEVRLVPDGYIARNGLRAVADMFVDAWFGEELSSDAQREQIVDEINMDMTRRYSHMRTADMSALLVAVRDDADSSGGEVIGCAGLELLSLTADGRSPRSWGEKLRASLRPHISNLAVCPSARRQGVGARLVRACEAEALAWGFAEQTLQVDEDNGPAMALYESLGYTVVSFVDTDKPVPRRGQGRRLPPGQALVWQRTTNAFLARSLGGKHA